MKSEPRGFDLTQSRLGIAFAITVVHLAANRRQHLPSSFLHHSANPENVVVVKIGTYYQHDREIMCKTVNSISVR